MFNQTVGHDVELIYPKDGFTQRNHTRINTEVTDQRSGGSKVLPRCGGNSPHPMRNYFEGKILKKGG